jgi:hypothetical protein
MLYLAKKDIKNAIIEFKNVLSKIKKNKKTIKKK